MRRRSLTVARGKLCNPVKLETVYRNTVPVGEQILVGERVPPPDDMLLAPLGVTPSSRENPRGSTPLEALRSLYIIALRAAAQVLSALLVYLTCLATGPSPCPARLATRPLSFPRLAPHPCRRLPLPRCRRLSPLLPRPARRRPRRRDM